MLFKPIAYSQSWKPTIYIACALGGLLPLMLILLEPFDTGEAVMGLKNLRLGGYGLCILLPILLLHPLENVIYRLQQQKWYVFNEACYIVFSLLLMLFSCFFYHRMVIHPDADFGLAAWWSFAWHFGLPFTPILLPVWLYMRARFGRKMESQASLEPLEPTPEQLILIGANKSERLKLAESDFIYAQAQQNYVLIYYQNPEGLQHQMIRSTLGKLMDQLPTAMQIHRSYLLNPDYVASVTGNARKRQVCFSVALEPIPVSQKYYEPLQKRLQIRP